jgi:enoyl-CoA hydratase
VAAARAGEVASGGVEAGAAVKVAAVVVAAAVGIVVVAIAVTAGNRAPRDGAPSVAVADGASFFLQDGSMTNPCEIVLDGPGKGALSTAVMESILSRLDEARNRPVLFSGKDDAFCAGLNLKEVASLDRRGMHQFVHLVEQLMERVFEHKGPTVACVNGHAIAGGCVLALCCDYRVMTDAPGARIGVNEVALGLVYPPKTMRIVKHRVPPRSLHEVVLRAALYGPKDALRLGLVDEVVGDVRAVAQERMAELAALPPRAYSSSKRALHEGVTTVPDHDAAIQAILPAWTDDSIKDRVRRQLEKKKV